MITDYNTLIFNVPWKNVVNTIVWIHNQRQPLRDKSITVRAKKIL